MHRFGEIPERDRSVSFDLSRSVGPASCTATFFASSVRHPIDVTADGRYGIFNASAVLWENKAGWRVGVEAYYTARQRLEHNPYRTESEPYVIFGAMVERRIGTFGFFFNAENFTDVRQTRWNPLLRPARGADGRWTVDAWAPLEGRVLNGGVRLRF